MSSSSSRSARNGDLQNGKATRKTRHNDLATRSDNADGVSEGGLGENGQGPSGQGEDVKDSLENISLRQKISRWVKTPSVSHVLIIALLGSAGGGLAVPLETPVLREFACEWYFNHKDSSKSTALIQTVFSILPASGMDIAAADQRCNIPAIAKLAGEIITAARILNALVTVLCLTIYSDLLSRYGRKPMFAFTAFCLTLSIAFFGLGAKIRGTWGITLITTSFALTGLGSQPLLQLTFQSYIVECVKSEERSPAFSLLGSATFAGLAVSALASAGMTAFTRIPLLPFWVGTGVFTAMFLYSLLILPEALTEKRREELMQANEQLQDYSSPSGVATPEDPETSRSSSPAVSDAPWVTFLKRLNFTKKLSIFLPRMDEQVHRRDYRLFLLAVSFTIYRIGSMYLNDLLLLTTTGSFGFGGVDNGLLISFVTACKAVLLLAVLPIAIRTGRKKYVKWLADHSSVHPTMEGLSESSRLLVDDDAGSSEDGQDVTGEDLQKKVAGSERFDLYFGGFSFIIDSLAFVAIGLSKQKWQLYLSTALLSISAAGGPSAQAVATQVTPKALSDQVLGAMSLIDEAGAILSPLVLGSIYSASTEFLPSLAWFVAGGLLLISAVIMLGTASIKWPPKRSY
ncbi:MFS general substrate transporter [Cystobasidium minutum MCA 4210]|uniref:MFS general substrate transporter n=1 Tax=Cystobasidium minutum MCA 4210 TaxID=1397322 RepID=UPI0034D01CA0|eukprot:jgi/Rhomi1/192578/gm1.792_g